MKSSCNAINKQFQMKIHQITTKNRRRYWLHHPLQITAVLVVLTCSSNKTNMKRRRLQSSRSIIWIIKAIYVDQPARHPRARRNMRTVCKVPLNLLNKNLITWISKINSNTRGHILTTNSKVGRAAIEMKIQPKASTTADLWMKLHRET